MPAARLSRRPIPVHGPWPDNVPPVLQRVYASRGVIGPEDAELRLGRLLSPDSLVSLDAAVGLLVDAIAGHRHIVIVGDFDCDGATGTAVAVRGRRMLGAQRVSYQVPHRITHGYGLSPALVDAMAGLQPDLMVTVDSGIACHAGVAAAKARGWQGPQQNGMVERVIRTIKEQCVHRHRFETLQRASRVIGDWIQFYNHRRPHQALGMKTPDEAYALAA